MFGIEASLVNWLLGPLGMELLRPVGVMVSLLVSGHVLLQKRDTAAAAGWIGLAWLAPLFGTIAYLMLGINRVKRRALKLRDARAISRDRWEPPPFQRGHDPLGQLEAAASRITQRPTLTGNRLTLFRNGDAAYPEMLRVIAEARASVALSSYILRDDAGGGPFIAALIAAQARGVTVRVLVDGVGSGYFRSPVYFHLRRVGVPAARFMHSLVPWRMPFLNLRTHKKILVVDGKVGFTGGMNIGAENLVRTNPPHPVRDTHFRIDGPVVAQLMDAFARDWAFVTNEILDGEVWFPDIAEAGEARARIVTSGPDQDLEKMEFLMLEAIACAQRSVRILTPYFLPHERLVTALALAALRGIEVDIVVPSKSDMRLLDWARRANIGPLLDQGCRIWYNPPPFDHSKVMVVDGTWCLIGSANWDMRSLRLNFELDLEVTHDSLAGQLEALITAAKGREVTQDDLTRRVLPARLRDALVRLLLPYL